MSYSAVKVKLGLRVLPVTMRYELMHAVMFSPRADHSSNFTQV
jgi:hypothetical protein